MSVPGKRVSERLFSGRHKKSSESCLDSSASQGGGGGLYSFRSSTAGSARVDVETAADVTITDTAVHLIDTNVKGPLGDGLSAFLLGRSSASKKGLDVIPGVIDADYQGVVKIMVRIFFPPVSIPKVILPFLFHLSISQNLPKGMNGFVCHKE
uniref:Uncharacterized protein n=1 Tax=Geospiza parvula TaxID=87175 RepID=A0A8U8AUN6_GEOPR